jgi:hypothetical protein
VLRSFQGQPDPTLRRASSATVPASASWPDVPAFVLMGAGIGLALALLAVLLLRLLRRRPHDRPVPYDRPVPEGQPDRAAEALVDRLEQRLHAREIALAARERDLQAKIDELEALAGTGGDDESLRERERQLEARVAAVTKREVELARRAAAAQAEPAPADDARERELAERERALEERVALVTKRELEVARRAAAPDPRAAELDRRGAELDRRQAELEERARDVAAREQELSRAPDAPPPAPAPAPAAPIPAAVPAATEPNGAFNLQELEQLVEARGTRFPGRIEEWRSYLFFLRDYAGVDGNLPHSFDFLVEETFRPLLN